MAIVPIATKFLGIRNVYLRTYTTSYVSLSGVNWSFPGNWLTPAQIVCYINADGTAKSFAARNIDLKTGYTNLTVGDASGTIDFSAFGTPCYDLTNRKVCGFVVGNISQQTDFPTLMEYSFPIDGGTYTLPNFQSSPSGLIYGPTDPNTGLPNPGEGINFITTGNNVFSSGEHSLVSETNIWARGGGSFGGGVATIANSVNGLQFPTSARHGGSIPYNGFDYILAANGTGGDNPWMVQQTNFTSGTTQWLPSGVENPASSTVDFNDFLIDSANQSYSNNVGQWLQSFASTQTFNGITMNGWWLRVLPDFSAYEILNVIGMDAVAATWNTAPGNGTAFLRTDKDGNIWVKFASVTGTLLVASFSPSTSAIANVSQQPIIPLAVNRGLYR